MKFILGKKLNMTQIFTENGKVLPVTKIQAGPCFIVNKKTEESDGYESIQLGYLEKKKINKPLTGMLKKFFPNKKFAYLKEIRIKDSKDETFKKLVVGQELDVDVFSNGDIVDITGVSKGKGFQGVVKRHGFSGSPASHGHKDQLRMPGSIGATGPAHVFKGTKMGGRMGGDQVTVKNLEVVKVDLRNNYLYVLGAVPGAYSGFLVIKGGG